MTSRTRTATRSGTRSGTKGVARADREQQILSVASEVFGDRGFAGTSVADVAELAGISKPLIYNYFGSKEGLFSACLARAGEVVADEIERTAQLGAVGAVRAVVTLDGIFRVLEPEPWLWRLFGDPTMPSTPEIDEIVAGYGERIGAMASEGVAELMSLAGDDDPLDLSAMTAVWTSVFDALVTWWLDHPGTPPAEMTQRATRLFSAVFGPVEVDPDLLAAGSST